MRWSSGALAGQRLGERRGGFDGEGGEVQVPKVDKGPPPLAPRLLPGLGGSGRWGSGDGRS